MQAQQQQQQAAQQQAEIRAAQAEADKERKRLQSQNAAAVSDRLAQSNRDKMAESDFMDFFNTARAKGTLVSDLQKRGIDVDAITFKTDASGKVSNIQGVKFVDTGTRQNDNNSDIFGSSQQQQQASKPEVAIFGSMTASQAKTAFQNPNKLDVAGMRAGYAQLQGAEQEAGAYYSEPVFGSLTRAQAANALYGPNVKSRQETQNFNVEQGYDFYKQKQSLGIDNSSKEIVKSDSFYYNPLMPFEVSKNPDDISIGFPVFPPGKGGSNAQAQNMRLATPATNPDFSESFKAGFQNYLENIPKSIVQTGQKLTGQQVTQRTAPEIEGAVFGVLGKGVQDIIGGRPITIAQDFGKIGGEIAENPGYALGSLVGTGAVTAATFGFGTAGKAVGRTVKEGLDIFSIGGKAEKIATTTAKEFGIAEKVGFQAFKVTKEGKEVALAQKGQVFTEPRFIPVPKGNSLFNIPGTSVSLRIPEKIKINVPTMPTDFSITKTTKETIEDIGMFAGKNDKGVFNISNLNVQKDLLVGQKIIPRAYATSGDIGVDLAKPAKELTEVQSLKGARAPATTVTDIYQNEASVFTKVSQPGIKGQTLPDIGGQIVRTGKSDVKIAESKFTGGSVASFSQKKMIGIASYAKKSALTPEEKAIFGAQAKKQVTPFDFAKANAPKLEKTSKGPLEQIQEFSFDRGLMRQFIQPEAATKGSSTLSKTASTLLGLGGGAAAFTSKRALGFGGLTGAERKNTQNTSESVDYGLDVLRTPPSQKQSSLEKVLSSNAFRPQTISRQNMDVTGKAANDLRSIMNTGEKQNQRTFDLLGIGLGERSITGQVPRNQQGIRVDQMFKLEQKTRQFEITEDIFKMPTPSPKEPYQRFNLPAFGQKQPLGKGGKGKKSKYYKKTSTTADIIRGAGFTKADSKRFQRMFGKF